MIFGRHTNRPGGFDVDNELDLHSLLKWEVGRFGALEDLSSVESKLTLRFGELPVRKLAHHEIGRDARLAGATPLLAHSSRNSRAHCGSIHRDFRPLSPPQITQSIPSKFTGPSGAVIGSTLRNRLLASMRRSWLMRPTTR